MPPEKRRKIYEFQGFRLDLAEKGLFRDDTSVPLTPKVFQTLQILVENAGHLVEKETLMQSIWPDYFVEESNLTFNIKMLRKALGDDAGSVRFIETIPRRGYRFIAQVSESDTEDRTRRTIAGQTEHSSDDSTLPKRVLLPVIGILIAGGLGLLGLWYFGSRAGEQTLPIMAAPFASEKLSTHGKVFIAVISRDGKNVVYSTEINGKQSIWLRQLDSANNVEIIPPSDDVYYGIALSPDGNFLYFSRWPRPLEGQTNIYRVSIFGGVPQQIIGEAQGWISVSPDGSTISFVRCYQRADEFCSLWIADSGTGQNQRKLTSRPGPVRIGDNKFSPDGRSIAFAVGQSENQANEFSLAEVDVESGSEREFTTEKFFNIKNLAWLPDKSGLLIAASRIPVKNFRIWKVSAGTGDVKPITKDSETYTALSLDNEARTLLTTQVKSDFHLHLYPIENPSGGRLLTNALTASFTPRGKIVFSSSLSGNDEIWSINADGTEQRQLTNDPADESAPVASPDDESIFFSSNRSGAVHVWRMKADGSHQVQITHKDGGFPIFVSPESKYVYYHHGVDRTLWRVRSEGSDEQRVLDKGGYLFALSPDGSQVAFAERQGGEGVIVIVSFADSAVRKFQAAGAGKKIMEIAWTLDGKSVAYTVVDSQTGNNTLWLQVLDARSQQQIADLGDDQINSLRFAPDGKSFAVVQGGWRHDAVLLRGLQ